MYNLNQIINDQKADEKSCNTGEELIHKIDLPKRFIFRKRNTLQDTLKENIQEIYQPRFTSNLGWDASVFTHYRKQQVSESKCQ
jgi:hypothetical protein